MTTRHSSFIAIVKKDTFSLGRSIGSIVLQLGILISCVAYAVVLSELMSTGDLRISLMSGLSVLQLGRSGATWSVFSVINYFIAIGIYLSLPLGLLRKYLNNVEIRVREEELRKEKRERSLQHSTPISLVANG